MLLLQQSTCCLDFAANAIPEIPIALAESTVTSTCIIYGEGNNENVGKLAESALPVDLEDDRGRRDVCTSAVLSRRSNATAIQVVHPLISESSYDCPDFFQAENGLLYTNRTSSSNALPREGGRRHTRSTSDCRSRQHERK